MGAMCAKNNAGDAAGQIPERQKPVAQIQTQWVSSGKNLQDGLTDGKDPDGRSLEAIVTEAAEVWLKSNADGWTYTGKHKQEEEQG